MFAQQIQSIEVQIQELNARLSQYRSLEGEVETALAAIAKVKQSALTLGVEDEVSQQIVEAVGVNQVGVNQSVDQPVVQEPTTEVEIQPVAETEQQVNQEVEVQPVVEDPTVKQPTPVPEPAKVDGEALIGQKVKTPEGLTGFAKSLEPLHKDMIIVEFTNGSSPYYKGDLQRLEDQSTPASPRPDRFYYQTAPEIKVGDAVQNYQGEICTVTQVKDFGGRTYVEVKNGEGRKEAFRPSDLKPVDKVEQEARESILPPTQQVEMPLGITTGDLVECPDGRVGHVSEVEFKVNTGRVATVVLPGGNAKIPVLELRYIGKYQPKAETTKKDPKDPEIEAQRLGAEILGKTWSDIREQTKQYPKALREAGLAARTKTQKKWVEQLPQVIADYILSSDDDSDLTWLPNSVKTRVQVLLQEARKAAA